MFRNKNVYILNFRKNSSTNQTKRNQRKVLRSVCGPRRAMRGRCTGCDARTSTGWLSVQAAPCTVRGLFAMCCARAGCIRAVRCDTQDAMRGPMRCELVAMQCAARGLVAFARCAVIHRMRCAGRCAANWLRCNALRAGWLHSRGAGGTMLLTEGF